MNLVRGLLVIVGLSMSLVGCSKSGEPAKTSDEVMLLGGTVPASKFYSYFHFKKTGETQCELAAPARIELSGEKPEEFGKPNHAQLSLVIHPDGRVDELYYEQMNGELVVDAKVESRWHIDGSELVIDGLGSGAGGLLGGERVIRMIVSEDSFATAYRGREIVISKVGGGACRVK